MPHTLTHTQRAELRREIARVRESQRRAEQAERSEQYLTERAARHTDESNAAELRDERSAELAERRRLRLAQLVSERHIAERDELRAGNSALAAAAETPSQRKRQRKLAEQRRDVLNARHRDEWQRVNAAAPMTSAQLIGWLGELAATIKASDDERADALGWMLLKVAERYGFTPSADELSAGYIRRRMAGRIADERARYERRNDSAAWAALIGDDDESDDEQAARIGANVWAAFTAPSMIGRTRAAQLGAEYLADALSIGNDDERLALTAALTERSERSELAAALGLSDANYRQRVSRGKRALRERWPSATELVAAVSSVQAESDDDDERVALSAELWAASELVDWVRCQTYRLTKSGALCSAPVGAGRWHTGMPSAPSVGYVADEYAQDVWVLPARHTDERPSRATEPTPSDEQRANTVAVELRRSSAYRAEQSEKVRAEMLAAALAELRAELAAADKLRAEPRRFATPSRSAAESIGSLGSALAAADAGRRRRRAAALRAQLNAELALVARRVIRRRWLATLAARHVERWQLSERRAGRSV